MAEKLNRMEVKLLLTWQIWISKTETLTGNVLTQYNDSEFQAYTGRDGIKFG